MPLLCFAALPLGHGLPFVRLESKVFAGDIKWFNNYLYVDIIK